MSTPAGLIVQPPLRPDPIIEPIDPRVFAAPAVITANQAYLVKFRVDRATIATGLATYQGASAGNVDYGIFTSTDNTLFTLLGSSGSTVAAVVSNMQVINLTANVPLIPGVNYWAAVVGDNVGLSLARLVSVANLGFYNKSMISKAALFPLATFSTSATVAYAPYLAIVTTG